MRAKGPAAVAAAATVLLAGCSGADHARVEPTPPASFATVVDTALQGDVSPEARDFLEALKPKGQMSFEDYRQGKALAQACLKNVGIQMTYYEGPGMGRKELLSTETVIPGSGVDPDAVPTLDRECLRRIEAPIDDVYGNQPTSIQAQDQWYVQHRPALVACLKKAGLTLDGDATWDDLMTAEVAFSDEQAECLTSTGFYPSQVAPGAGG